ncbi:hypothetical protein KNV74_gp12 [Staphylococcus phage LSA2366]|uniref:Uncharacterized protein n=1 Tax=Staphylococcus phage LSA2366 TaxID=2797417 RepID=A0A7T7Z811_9CAUD|nr:hypothetical protein KNV74_gp12 [Staphylococcus phage LSA2366]QQO38235.1 hypothetical protein LSA2366_0012 [Staphylococcus phage LSA2366]
MMTETINQLVVNQSNQMVKVVVSLVVTGRMHSYQKNIKKQLVYLYSKKNIYTNQVTYFLKRVMQDNVQN